MNLKLLATTGLVASLSFTPVSPLVAPARADTRDVVAGLIIGGIVGAAINEESKKKKKKTTTSKSKSTKAKAKSSGQSAEQRAANVEVQEALNLFGWPVGTADGAIGPKSRAAIGEYQAFLGNPATGALTEEERAILVTAHARAKAGGAAIQEIVSGSVHGIRGVILTQRDEMRAAGGTVTAMAPAAPLAATATAIAAAAEPPAPPVPQVEAAPADPALAAAATGAPALPSFMDANGARGALGDACNGVMLSTNANGGYQTAEGMQDAALALDEQFCLARASAIQTGDALAARVAGFTPDQIAQQCAAFGPALKDQVAALSLRPADQVLAGVEAFILQSGMSPAQLSGTAKVCLSVAYRSEQMDVAIGSALLLAAMGERGYAELLGHHLARGFGATERPELALGWYDIAIGAMRGGSDVFAPGMAGRDDLLTRAAYTIAGRGAEVAPKPDLQEAALPTFALVPEVEAPVVAATETAPLPAAPALAAAPAPVTAPETEAAPAAMAAAPAPAPLPAVPGPAAPTALALLPEAGPEAPAAPLAAPGAPAAPGALAVTAPPGADGPGGEVMRAGAQAAMAAARLPFFLFAAY